MKSTRPRVLLVNRCFVLNERKEFLFIQRSQTDTHNPSLWEAPGGKLDEGQDLSRALEREVIEETGLLVEPSSRLVYADSYIVGDGKYKGLPYIVLFSIGRLVGGTLKLSDEHDDAKWVTYAQALTYDMPDEVRKALIVLGKHLT